jgi:hypothetical protein
MREILMATPLPAFAPHDVATPPRQATAAREPSVVLERVARALRGARARTGLSEAEVVAMLERQGIALSVPALCRAESTGVMTLAIAACLADVYGTTTDALAGRRLGRERFPLQHVSAPS